MNLRIATAAGLVDPGSGAPGDGPVRVFGDALIVGDHRLFWHGDAGWYEIGQAPGLRCAVDAPGGLVVGTEGAHLLRLGPTGLTRIEAFETMPGRDEWYTPWGGPPEIRSLACTADNVLLRQRARRWHRRAPTTPAASWTPDDRHPLRRPPGAIDLGSRRPRGRGRGRRLLPLATTAASTWRVLAEGLHATYCRAVAVPDEAILVSASEGPRGKRAAIYRTSIHGDTPFERVTDWIDGNVDTAALDGARRPGRVRHRGRRGLAVDGLRRDLDAHPSRPRAGDLPQPRRPDGRLTTRARRASTA